MKAFFRWRHRGYSHRQARRQIQAAADNPLTAAKQHLLEEHLTTCVECRTYADQLHALENVLLRAGRYRNLGNSFTRPSSSNTRSISHIVASIRSRYRSYLMRRRFVSTVGALAVLGVFVAAFFLLGKLSQYSDVTPVATPALSTAAAASAPSSGEWVATIEFGKFIITVNDKGTRIIRMSYQFSKWACGSITKPGEIVDASDWLINNNEFEAYTPFDRDSQSGIYINGTYDATNQKFSGTWEEFSNATTCSGTWEASAPK
jgi:hypothetical protein